ncbi:hypothetical protein J2T08_000522 [Neorhizobium galegae]|uniref:hypothetical protein n=1 Tax=Neorhizobium galegae TaxID=399 RepID=UPI00278258C2|nr:hypothetical protein [Neorhizobium galegae]MDQ0132621.1 hypothetical protein [Neorhizobium galegae]
MNEKHRHWRVSVETSGEQIVAIEPEMLAGREISEADEDAIRTAAHHLLAFIGDPAPQPNLEVHPDDRAVDRFASAMKAKLAQKRDEGRSGWNDKEDCSQLFLSQLLREHVEKGDPIDVGNFAMMLHQREERIASLLETLQGE